MNPSARDGRGPAEYRLERGSELIWQGERPYTLLEAVVTDDGTAVGYTYTCGSPDWQWDLAFARESDPDCELSLIVFAPDGVELARHRLPAQVVHYMEGASLDPLAVGVLVHPQDGRVTWRTQSSDEDGETWYTTRLDATAELSRIRIVGRQDSWGRSDRILAARPVAGTPLTLIHRRRDDDKRKTVGATFSLLDPQGRVVWTLDRPRDYQVPGNGRRKSELHRSILNHGAILDVRHAGRFEVRFANPPERVTFAVRRLGESATDWSVNEIARGRWKDPPPETDPFVSLSPRPTRLTDEFRVEPRQVEGGLGANVHRFDVDDQGRVGLVGGDCGNRVFVLMSGEGERLREIALEPCRPGGLWPSIAWAGGSRWIILERGSTNTPGLVVAVDVEREEAHPLIEADGVNGLASWGGGFLLLIEQRERFYSGTTALRSDVVGYDDDGAEVWRHAGGGMLFEGDVAALTADRLALLGVGEVSLTSRDGRVLREVDLEEAFGREMGYLASVTGDGAGGFLIEDSAQGKLLWIDRDGKRQAELVPRFRDGRAVGWIDHVVVSPADRIWVSDGVALLRLTDEGVVDAIIGPGPDDRELAKVSAAAVDDRGRLFLLDASSGSVHVVGGGGESLFRFDPIHEARPGGTAGQSLVVAPDGSTFVQDNAEGMLPSHTYVIYGPEGARQRSLSLHFMRRPIHAQGDGAPFWAEGMTEVYLMAPDGETLREVNRRPDGLWLESIHETAMAPDGSLAAVSGDVIWSDQGSRTLNLYTATGEGIRTLELPESLDARLFAYDGENLYLSRPGEVCVLDLQGQPQERLAIPELVAGTVPLLGPESTEIWLWEDSSMRVRRYAREKTVRDRAP